MTSCSQIRMGGDGGDRSTKGSSLDSDRKLSDSGKWYSNGIGLLIISYSASAGSKTIVY